MFEELGLDDENNASLTENDDGEGLPLPAQNSLCLGHERVEQNLLDSHHQGQLPHALIFAGPPGIGKATFAYRFIRFLLSPAGKPPEQLESAESLFGDDLPPPEKKQSFDIPDQETLFSRIGAGGHPDLRVLERRVDERTGKLRTTLDLSEIREIRSFMQLTPAEAGWRIALIDEAERMNHFSQNSLLKILEEPPDNSLLIIVTSSAGALIPTIRSRSRIYNFRALSMDNMSVLIQKMDPQIPHSDRLLLARLSHGQIGLAQKYYESGGLQFFSRLVSILSNWPDLNRDEIYKLADQLSAKGQEAQYESFRDILKWILMELVRAKANEIQDPDLVPGSDIDTSALNRLYNDMTKQELIRLHDKIEHYMKQVDDSFLDKRQAVLNTFFKLTDTK